MESSQTQTHPLSEILDNLLRRFGYDKKIREQHALFLWSDVVGEHVARNAQPTQIVNGKMSVIVSDTIWLTELNFLRLEYIKKLNEALGAKIVTDIEFKIGEVKQHVQSPRANKKTTDKQTPTIDEIELTDEEQALISQVVADVDDAELQEILRGIFTKQSKRDKIEKGGFKRHHGTI